VSVSGSTAAWIAIAACAAVAVALAVVLYLWLRIRSMREAQMMLLDAARSGVVFSAIQGRDYARIYVKELDHGRAPVALSPEEQEAVERAMAN
jgi:anti-sigma-K factor RskA